MDNQTGPCIDSINFSFLILVLKINIYFILKNNLIVFYEKVVTSEQHGFMN